MLEPELKMRLEGHSILGLQNRQEPDGLITCSGEDNPIADWVDFVELIFRRTGAEWVWRRNTRRPSVKPAAPSETEVAPSATPDDTG